MGDIDFVTVTISKNKEDYERILDELTDIEEIERTDSRTVLKTYKEYDISSIFSEVGD
ncbi:MAG: Lrp/AsnC ligand binding domain-containing protein [Thermoplasmataceae archaeon]